MLINSIFSFSHKVFKRLFLRVFKTRDSGYRVDANGSHFCMSNYLPCQIMTACLGFYVISTVFQLFYGES